MGGRGEAPCLVPSSQTLLEVLLPLHTSFQRCVIVQVSEKREFICGRC